MVCDNYTEYRQLSIKLWNLGVRANRRTCQPNLVDNLYFNLFQNKPNGFYTMLSMDLNWCFKRRAMGVKLAEETSSKRMEFPNVIRKASWI